jgi:pyruvate,water dikinase
VAILRKLGTAWRIGRLRVALPTLIDDVIAAVDRDLASIPRLDELTDDDLVGLLDRGRRELATVHTHEVLAGMLLRADPITPTGAAVALQALHDARCAGWEDDAIVAGSPVVLVLVPPSLDRTPLPDSVSSPVGAADALDRLGQREALRVRARWVQELLARGADELGRRLVARGVVAGRRTIGHLRLSELTTIADGGPPPTDLAARAAHWPGPPLPVSFRLSVAGEVRPASVSSHSQRIEWAAGMPAGGGRVVGVACHRPRQVESPDGAILVTRHLEPQLAPALGHIAGLVSETGSALSHLAILAREAGIPTVVAVPDALRRFPAGTRLMIDGQTGEIDILDRSEERSGDMREAGS